MPRLPGPEAVGNVPSMRPSGSPATISAESPIASGLNRVGGQITQIATQQQERDDALQAAEADAHLTTGLASLRRQFEQDGDWSTFEPRFQSEAERLRAEASGLIRTEGLRRRWQPRADVAVSGALDGVLSRGRRLQSESEFDRLDTVLGSLSTRYAEAPDDDARNTIMRNIEDTIELGRRSGIVPPERIRDLRRRHLQGAVEADVNARAMSGDGYAALLELREGDARAQTPSTGQVSDAGLSQIQRMFQRPGQTPAEARAEQRRLQTEAGRLSRWMGENLVGEDGQQIPLTQLQHDALAAYAMSRVKRAGGRGSPEDVIQELLPTLRTGNWESVASVIRAGDLNAMEQPAPGGATSAPGGRASAPDLGSVSARYESGGRGVGFISSGQGDPGGPSYGIHQLSGASSMGAFLASPEGEAYRAEFGGSRPMTADFNAIYRRIADRDPEGFAAAQRAFYTRTHYEPARQAAEQAGFDVSSRAVQEALFSIGVQHGGARNIIQRAAGQIRPGASVEDQIRALYDARSQYVRGLSSLPESTRQAVLSRYQREVQDVLSLARGDAPSSSTASADPNLSTIGDMVLGQAPSSRYARLPVDRRRVVMDHLATALRGDATDGINGDIESITRTGRARTLPDGSTWLERARRARIFTPLQLAGFERRVRLAESRFRALNGLSDMNPEEMEQRISELDTSRVGEGEDYATAASVRESAARARERLLQLRRSDPALWASGTYLIGARGAPQYNARGEVVTAPAEDDVRVQPAREVVEAHATLARRHPQLQIQFNEQDGTFTASAEPAPGELSPSQTRPQVLRLTDPRLTPEDRRLMIEARLAAQARVGIPETERRALSSAEARELLGLPQSITGMTADRYTRTLREAADRAEQLFGPRYARLAFETALGFRQQSQDQREVGASVARALPGGSRDALTPAELSRLASLRALSAEEAMWRYGPPSYPLPSAGEGLPFGPVMGIPGAPAPQAPGWFSSAPPAPPVPPSLAPSAGARAGMPANMPSVPGVSVAPTGSGPAQFGRPSQEDVSALLESPLRRQEAFDRRFGPGSAAMYLRQAQEGGVSVGRPIRQGR